MKVAIVRYSEIHLKGHNRGFFEKTLANNLKKNLADLPCKVAKSPGRYVITDFPDEFESEIVQRAANTFGVYSVSVAEEVETDLEKIAALAVSCAPEKGTFKVEVNRADKTFPLNSMQLAAELGGRILDAKPNLSVKLNSPEHTVFVDLRENGRTYVFGSVYKGVNGMPVGTGGKAVVMLSGGIDSPVAAYMMAKRGMSLRAVHFHSYPYTSLQAKEKVLTLANIVKKYTMNMPVDVVSFTEIQTAIHEHCPEELMITIMRRFMMRIAEKLAKKHGCGAVVTGESLGQVASQTLESITCTNSVATMPVLRPLIGFDKDEIIAISKNIGTFETSILPYEDCCTIFLPDHPATHPRVSIVEKAESALDVETLVQRAVESVETF